MVPVRGAGFRSRFGLAANDHPLESGLKLVDARYMLANTLGNIRSSPE